MAELGLSGGADAGRRLDDDRDGRDAGWALPPRLNLSKGLTSKYNLADPISLLTAFVFGVKVQFNVSESITFFFSVVPIYLDCTGDGPRSPARLLV